MEKIVQSEKSVVMFELFPRKQFVDYRIEFYTMKILHDEFTHWTFGKEFDWLCKTDRLTFVVWWWKIEGWMKTNHCYNCFVFCKLHSIEFNHRHWTILIKSNIDPSNFLFSNNENRIFRFFCHLKEVRSMVKRRQTHVYHHQWPIPFPFISSSKWSWTETLSQTMVFNVVAWSEFSSEDDWWKLSKSIRRFSSPRQISLCLLAKFYIWKRWILTFGSLKLPLLFSI